MFHTFCIFSHIAFPEFNEIVLVQLEPVPFFFFFKLTVIRVFHPIVFDAALGLMQDALVMLMFAFGGGLQLLHNILELLQHVAQLQLQVCGKFDSSWNAIPDSSERKLQD